MNNTKKRNRDELKVRKQSQKFTKFTYETHANTNYTESESISFNNKIYT